MASYLDHFSELRVEGYDLNKCLRLGFEGEMRCVLQKRIMNRVLGNKCLCDLPSVTMWLPLVDPFTWWPSDASAKVVS